MPVFGTQNFGSGATSAYEIEKSCIFNGTDAYMSRTPGSAGNQKTMTQSMWVKRGKVTTDQAVGINTAEGLGLWLNANDTMTWYCHYDSGWEGKLTTTKTFRDPAAWYHIVTMVDTTQAVAANRAKIYVNGTQISDLSLSDYPDQNDDTAFNAAAAHSIGIWLSTPSYYYNGYIAEMHWIDGTALTPSSFGETNDEGVWVPKKYSGSYGTTGFYLDFADSSDLGDDESGQGNDWAETNLAASDQSTDTPTNNHVTWNSVYPLESTITLSEGNRNYLNSAGSQDKALGTLFPSTGKWYWEVKWVSGSSHGQIGLSQCDVGSNQETGSSSSTGTGTAFGYRSYDGKTYKGNSLSTFGDSWTTADIISVAWDADNGKIYFGKNDTWQNSGDPTSGATGTGSAYALSSAQSGGGGWGPAVCNEGSSLYEARFAEAEWSYSAPTGYTALCTSNMAEPAIKDGSKNFQMDDYAGTGSTLSRTFGGNSDMKPDILWIKAKNTTTGWIEFNAAVGVQKYNTLNEQGGETSDSNSLTAFNTDGFTVGSLAAVNSGSYGFFGFGWSAGNSGSSNEDGGINTTTTFVDATAGISVGTYTGTGSGATVGHGLGVTPATVIIFPRSNGDHKPVANWQSGISAYGEKWKLNETEAAASSSGFVTAASSTTFTLGTDTGVNGSSRTYSYYAFAEVPGFSKFGTYTGNGNADGTFVWCGFRPAIIIVKADTTNDWVQFNTKTDPNGNPAINYSYPNDTDAFATSTNYKVDFLSNGVKMRGTEGRINADGQAIVFMAFAENPFGGEDAAPATAR